jgi:hypothetical protein
VRFDVNKFKCGILSIENGKFEFWKTYIIDTWISKDIYFWVTKVVWGPKDTIPCKHAYMYDVFCFLATLLINLKN